MSQLQRLNKTTKKTSSVVLASALMIIIVMSSFGPLLGINILAASSAQSCPNPIQSFQIRHTLYVKNCFYEVGISTVNGGINYTTIAGLSSNKTMTAKTGLLAEELDVGFGGSSQFTKATVSVVQSTSSIVEIKVSGVIKTILSGTENLTFFSSEPYFVASLSSTILTKEYYTSHDVANYVRSPWTNTWVAPISNGTVEICNASGCSGTNGYSYPYPGGFDTGVGDIKSNIQTNGPTWGWLGTSSAPTGTGIGFMLLSVNSTEPAEAAITHYELNSGRFEVEGDGVAPADPQSNKAAPHDLGYSVNAPQTIYESFLVYLNNAPWTTFYTFAQSVYVSTQFGSYPASASNFGTFAEATRSPNLNDNKWYITNLVTSASGPLASVNNGMIYFTSRNGSLANDFPLKMYLSINGSTNEDKNFGNGVPLLISNTPSDAKIEITWTNSINHLKLVLNFTTKSNTDKINVTGYLAATSSSVKINSLALQMQVFNNYIDGTGAPNQSPTSINNLSWNYTNGKTSVGVAIAVPGNNGFTGATFPNSTVADLNMPFTSSSPTNFAFAVSFYSPISNYYPGYTENINVPTMKIITQLPSG
jgi:hypothetical protein